MIQRKQTLFLFQLIFFGIALLFISSKTVTTSNASIDIALVPAASNSFQSTLGHLAAIGLNLLGLILTFITIFLFKKRELQIKLCYGLMLIWLTISLMILFCPFVKKSDGIPVEVVNYFSAILGLMAIVAVWFAINFIKKDIELIKSADRIR